jgi:xylulokinase
VDENCNPLMNCLTWLDTRAAEIARKIVGGRLFKYNLISMLRFIRITGGGPGLAGKDPISKILWLKYNEPDIYRDTYKFLDVKDYLAARCTGNFTTSMDNANLTWLMDTRKNRMCWSDTLLKKYGIDREKLPEIRASTDVVGKLTKKAAEELGLLEGTPIVSGAGDITSAAIGSGAVLENEIHAYVGTSDWLAAHMKKRKLDIFHYIGCLCSANPEMYLCIAEQETAGACYEWLKSNFFESLTPAELDRIASEAEPGSGGLIFTPWMFGERAPIDDDEIRAGFYNLSLDHTRSEVVRAVLEGVALNMKWALKYFEKLTGQAEYIHFIGGGAKSDLWLQIFADALKREVRKIAEPEQAGAKGAAMIAMVGLGYLRGFEDVKKLVRVEKVFKPSKERAEIYDKLFERFRKIYKKKVSRAGIFE